MTPKNPSSPTDAEIFEKWRDTDGGIILDPNPASDWVECDRESYLRLISQARQAGREEGAEEQREKTSDLLQAAVNLRESQKVYMAIPSVVARHAQPEDTERSRAGKEVYVRALELDEAIRRQAEGPQEAETSK